MADATLMRFLRGMTPYEAIDVPWRHRVQRHGNRSFEATGDPAPTGNLSSVGTVPLSHRGPSEQTDREDDSEREQPTEHAHRHCADRAPVIQRLAYGHDHG